MRLSRKIIERIEGLLEKGSTVELRVEEGDPLPRPGGGTIPRPLQVTIFKRPDQAADIKITPTLLSESEHTNIQVVAIKFGEVPVPLLTQEVPPGYWISGITGYQGDISQEIESAEESEGE